MKVYLDIFTGDELCSDAYPTKVVDDVYYEVEGKVRLSPPPLLWPERDVFVIVLEHHRVE